MSAPDERTAEIFNFHHLINEEERWAWQRDFLKEVHHSQRMVALKARQLGVTWLCCAYVVWTALYRPGTLSLVYRQKHEEAQENVRRCWQLLQSLPSHLQTAEILIPQRGAVASEELRLQFSNGSLSRVLAMSSASASGHGKTAAVVLLDEFSRIERAAEIFKAVQPAAGSKGKILVISTANGVSNAETGEGNYFHYLWTNADEAGFDKKFLGWYLHPDRDQDWYENDPEIKGLRSYERAEQYPGNEDEAFSLSSNNFFEPEEIQHYAPLVPPHLYRFEFRKKANDRAVFKKTGKGAIRVYREPQASHKYAIGADVASGVGLDFSAAAVIDLSNMEIAAEFYDHIDPDLFAFQLHYLGKWYRDALIAVENQGGYGIPVIVSLRDGREGRPHYPNLYRHVLTNRPDMPTSKPYGIPMGSNTRPQILNGLGKAVREGFENDTGLPYMGRVLLDEAKTFLRGPLPGQSQAGTWPRAQGGAHDDMIMATAIAVEMHRMYGHHPAMKPMSRRTKKENWLSLGNRRKVGVGRGGNEPDASPWS